MTVASERETKPAPEGHVRLTIDGVEVDAPKGELLIRTAERMGITIPRFCDHPLLDPAGACRQCLVEVEMNGRAMPKPQASCTMTVADGMVVKTQNSSPVADKAQQGVMELLLINHPLDCPICDKGGECPLQNQALKHGRAESRFHDTKRTFAKPVPISAQVLLDRERCVLCQRCTRFSKQIAGDPFIELLERGAVQQIGIAEQQPFQSYFSGNTIQICPVGALTSAAYRFRSRPFDLVSTPGVCEHCSSGCATRTDWRRGKVMRKLAAEDPEVNEEWICDKGRFGFRYATATDRFTRPLVREGGELRPASWTEALRKAAEGLLAARDDRGVGVLPGGRLTVEDAYAYAKFARIALRTNDIDARARAHSDEELAFLASTVVGTAPDAGAVTYADLEAAPAVLCVAFEPEEEAPIVFLRLRKAARKGRTKVFHLGQWNSPGVEKTTRIMSDGGPVRTGALLPCPPGGEAAALAELPSEVDELLSAGGAVLAVGERAAQIPGLYSELVRTAARTGARIAWIPRRAGERGAVEAGALPTLLPGGRGVGDLTACAEVAQTWGVDADSLPAAPGRDTTGILRAAARGDLGGLLIGGVDPDDLPDPELARTALAHADFVVSVEMRPTAVTEHADVVLPIAPSVEKAGSYLNWEGRRRDFRTTIEGTGALPDCRVLDTLAVEMDADLFTQSPAAARAELDRLGTGTAAKPPAPDEAVRPAAPPGPGRALLATWRQLLDDASLQVEEPNLAGTRRDVVAMLSPATAQRLGVRERQQVEIRGDRGAITVEARLTEMPDEVVWLPGASGPSQVNRVLGVGHGAAVALAPAVATTGGSSNGHAGNGHSGNGHAGFGFGAAEGNRS
ncbi:NADH-quinone oxidoreductase subunit G [Saccharopolyspora gloriosae]|uniref:NADH-quinone oxidoreductase n=1 Tax=Saccharopolyspora gloriosae TaxID=455344 RepID=A0A840NFD8_9PSEU|nr:NADH-quinone oxidoreductase subunit G [Saccharopolyspora gloriosae]MBB5066987.1 NADH-quinone oxidoreductase subunit G [Saccharopolyspora gloriosae]